MQKAQAQIYNKYTQTHNVQYTFYTTTSHNMCYQTFFYAGTCWFYTFRRSAACLASLSFPQTINVQHLVIHITINKMCINLLTLTYKTCTLYLVEKGLLQLARATLMHAVRGPLALSDYRLLNHADNVKLPALTCRFAAAIISYRLFSRLLYM